MQAEGGAAVLDPADTFSIASDGNVRFSNVSHLTCGWQAPLHANVGRGPVEASGWRGRGRKGHDVCFAELAGWLDAQPAREAIGVELGAALPAPPGVTNYCGTRLAG